MNDIFNAVKNNLDVSQNRSLKNLFIRLLGKQSFSEIFLRVRALMKWNLLMY